MNDKSVLSNRLKTLRKESGATQATVCEAVLQQQYFDNLNIEKVLSNYENGRRKPDYETILKFAEFYNVSTDYLLGASEHKNEKNLTVNEQTGLSDDAIAALGKISKTFTPEIMDLLNYILSNENAISLLIDINNLSLAHKNTKEYYKYYEGLPVMEREEQFNKDIEAKTKEVIAKRQSGKYPTIELAPPDYEKYRIIIINEKVHSLIKDIVDNFDKKEGERNGND